MPWRCCSRSAEVVRGRGVVGSWAVAVATVLGGWATVATVLGGWAAVVGGWAAVVGGWAAEGDLRTLLT